MISNSTWSWTILSSHYCIFGSN